MTRGGSPVVRHCKFYCLLSGSHEDRSNSKASSFYTHPIGSLPRPQAVLDLLANSESMAPGDFRARMDDMVVFAIRLQEQAGLDVVSDGEWRRSHYMGEFLERVGGFQKSKTFYARGRKKVTLVCTGRISLSSWPAGL